MDKLTSYFIVVVFLGCAILSLYRSTLTESDLVKLSGILKSAKIIEIVDYNSKGGKKHTYPIVLEFEGEDQLHGFYFSNKEKANDVLNNINLKIGNRYTIFYYPTVITGLGNNVKLGIIKIKENDKVILEETNFRNKILGFVMLGFSLILFLVLLFADKIKKILHPRTSPNEN
ncbi:MAG: hypothetical protein RQ875_09800 [Vicingaceae bacterium]|nr:hypothetical protein [Vicingaceae bacterium]